ncbi:MAG: LamG-like jellyroll fold domain-containing protein [Euryarchaeota archaeon]|nr:LamG-like jellyroll fold domain-containing protein [Euryarchaeota archaeon]
MIALFGLPAGVQAQSDEWLVAEWHFDEGSGSVLKDSSGNGNDGVIYGATWVDGKYWKALEFDGVDDYVDCGNDTSLDVTGDVTVETWVKFSSTANNYYAVLDKRGGTGIYEIWQKSDTTMTFSLGGANISSNTFTPMLGQWYHIAASGIVGQSGHRKIFINGVDVTSDTGGAPTSVTGGSLTIGAYGIGSGEFFKGIIDEVRIYNRTLTAEDIKEHYEQGPTALSITKTATPKSIKQGQTTTITLTLKNTGSTEIKDIEIADTIPQDLTFIDGETSKTYSSMTSKDSRKFQYVVQINEAGTYNLNPATAIYADEKGNYHTVKSKPVAIEVIPSLVETTDQIRRTAGSNTQSASVHLHGEKTNVVMSEDILLKLAAVNLITKPTMHVQVIITPPSGMSVTSSEFVQSGAGLFTASYEIEPGVGRDIEVKMRSNQVGDFVVNGRIVYYFGDDVDGAEDHTLTLSITVRAEANAGAGAE